MNRRTVTTRLGALCIGASAIDCQQAPPPFPQTVLVVDTDLPVPTLASHLRIDVFDTANTWISSQDVPLRSAEDFPASFSVYVPDDQATRLATVRLRLRPDDAERDYRGERYVPFPSEDATPASVEQAEQGVDLRLLEQGIDRTPVLEPLPSLTVDRLVTLRIAEAGVRKVRVTLRGDCLGRMTNLAAKTTCIDAERTDVPLDEGDGPDDERPTLVGTRLGDATREVTNIPPTARPVRGGAFILGSTILATPSIGAQKAPSSPPRASILHGFAMDRTEVTVGRFRAALEAGFVPPVPVVENKDPVATSSVDFRASCTFTPNPADASRDELPVTCVPFDTAREFCIFSGGDLPTEAQWEYAASSAGRPRKTMFPWGEAAPTCEGVVFGRFDDPANGDGHCYDQGFPFGARGVNDAALDETPDGIRGLAGNVYEWIRGAPLSYDSACYRRAGLEDPVCDVTTRDRAIRGAAFGAPASALALTLRLKIPAGGSTPLGGFRCVYAQ